MGKPFLSPPKVGRWKSTKEDPIAKILNLSAKTALITGAASGIGRATAIAFARRGCHLALADIDETGLDETARLAGAIAPQLRVSRHRLDVTDRDAIAAFPVQIRDTHVGLDILINNAGVAVGGHFEEIDEQDFDWLLAVNFFGVVRMTRAFLPMLRASDEARIVNISSLFGLIATPGQTAYTASKFAVRGFSESLRHELAGTRVGVTTVFPGGVATSIAMNARLPRDVTAEDAEHHKRRFSARLKLPAETAAEAITSAVERCQPRLVLGRDAKIAAFVERMLPTHYWDVLSRFAGGSRDTRARA